MNTKRGQYATDAEPNARGESIAKGICPKELEGGWEAVTLDEFLQMREDDLNQENQDSNGGIAASSGQR